MNLPLNDGMSDREGIEGIEGMFISGIDGILISGIEGMLKSGIEGILRSGIDGMLKSGIEGMLISGIEGISGVSISMISIELIDGKSPGVDGRFSTISVTSMLAPMLGLADRARTIEAIVINLIIVEVDVLPESSNAFAGWALS